ncbi:MAG: hypothetical protein AAF715_12120 [Myxococcota bacterium]
MAAPVAAFADVGRVPVDALGAARRELHWAFQVLAAAGHSLGTARNDDRHTAAQWNEARGAFITAPLPDRRLALEPATLTLGVVQGRSLRPRFPVGERTLDEAMTWAATALGAPEALRRPGGYTLPSHPVADGDAFTAPGDETTELAAWFRSAASLLGVIAKAHAEASPLTLWPHHFDLATLITLDPGAKAETARSIGVGFSPGDATYDRPYFYVTPWPYPDGDLPELLAGRWHRDGFTAAVLTGDEITALNPADRPELVGGFVATATRAARTLLQP